MQLALAYEYNQLNTIIDNHIEKGEILNIDLGKSKEIPLNALLEIASSTEVKSVLLKWFGCLPL